MLKKSTLVLVNAALTAAVFGYLFRHVTPGEILGLLREVERRGVVMFLVLSLSTSVVRLWRYRVILRVAGQNPPAFPLFLVVLVRNAFSDLLPARLGTLTDVYLFTTRLGVPLPAAVSCHALTFVFEIVALAPLIALAAWSAGAAGTLPAGGLLGGAAVLLAVTVPAVLLLPRAFRAAAALSEAVLPGGWALRERLGGFLRQVSEEVRRVRDGGVYGRVFALSVTLRLTKYASLYVFLYALLAPMGYGWDRLDPARVFLGLCASELAASLPVSGLAGFGAYEGAWAAAFQLLGFPGEIAKATGVAHHLFTQAYGYSLGGAALLLLFAPVVTRGIRASAPPARESAVAFAARLAGFAAVVVAAELVLAGAPWARSASVAAMADTATAREERARAAVAAELGGEILFDSTRSGTFGIYRMRPDGTGLRPVADGPAHEMYPDPSPDGRLVVYARAEALAKRAPSEIRLCGSDGSGDRKLAARGTFPTFSADGRTVFFERERSRVMAVGVDGGGEREIFPAGRDFGRAQIVKPRVSPDGRRVAFISDRGGGRGWQVWTADLATGEARRVSDGCEPGWMPDGARLVQIRERGMRERTGIVLAAAGSGILETLHDGDAPRGHEYFPTVTADGGWLLWGACPPGEHDHLGLGSNYQLFARRLPDGAPVRITFDAFSNRWPKALRAR